VPLCRVAADSLVRKPRVTHPAGRPMAMKPVSTMLNRSDFIANLMNNVHVPRIASVTTSSKVTYNTGWKAWCEFMQYMGTDVDASTPPPEWLGQVDATGSAPLSWRVTCACAFLSYCRTHRGLLPSTCSTYLSGVTFNLRMRDVWVAEITESPAVAETKAGLMRAWREEDERNTVAARSNLPFTASMIEYALVHFLSDWATDAAQHSLKVAMILGFMLCARPSEIVEVPDRDGRLHFMRGKDMRFTVRHRVTGAHVIVVSGKAYLVNVAIYSLIDALPHVRHSKADQHGEGTTTRGTGRVRCSRCVVQVGNLREAGRREGISFMGCYIHGNTGRA